MVNPAFPARIRFERKPPLLFFMNTKNKIASEVKLEKDEETTGTAEEKAVKAKKENVMMSIFNKIDSVPSVGDLVEGKVIGVEKARLYVDLQPYGTGVILGREYISVRDIIRKINPGDSIAAKVVEAENKEGYTELSLKEARQAMIWSEAEEAIRNKTTLELTVQEANKGGLIINWQGVAGFLPASQLKAEHYPKIADGDKDKILVELKKLVGQKISAVIISALPKEGKLIFSEKSPEFKNKEKIAGKYKVGDDVEGEVAGVVDFGAFVKIEDGLEGLVHISEINWSLVEDPRSLFKIVDKIKVKIIEIKDGKISLSVKALKENPWKNASKKYKKGDTVSGVVIRFNKYGALASIEEGVAGLVHMSEFGSEAKLKEKLELGKSYPFQITIFDPKDQKMTLSFMGKKMSL